MKIHADVISRSVIVVQIHANIISCLLIAVQIHAVMVSHAVNDLQNREALKKLESN